ncbi:unnamed protein product [Ectocarpus sp. 8 AP-2014]
MLFLFFWRSCPGKHRRKQLLSSCSHSLSLSLEYIPPLFLGVVLIPLIGQRCNYRMLSLSLSLSPSREYIPTLLSRGCVNTVVRSEVQFSVCSPVLPARTP